MKELTTYLKKSGACEKLIAETFDDLSKQMFSGVGIEYLENVKLPLELFEKNAEMKGVHVNKSVKLENQNCLLANSTADIIISDNKQIYVIILLHGSKATINISNYAVVLIKELDGKAEISIDKSSILL